MRTSPQRPDDDPVVAPRSKRFTLCFLFHMSLLMSWGASSSSSVAALSIELDGDREVDIHTADEDLPEEASSHDAGGTQKQSDVLMVVDKERRTRWMPHSAASSDFDVDLTRWRKSHPYTAWRPTAATTLPLSAVGKGTGIVPLRPRGDGFQEVEMPNKTAYYAACAPLARLHCAGASSTFEKQPSGDLTLATQQHVPAAEDELDAEHRHRESLRRPHIPLPPSLTAAVAAGKSHQQHAAQKAAASGAAEVNPFRVGTCLALHLTARAGGRKYPSVNDEVDSDGRRAMPTMATTTCLQQHAGKLNCFRQVFRPAAWHLCLSRLSTALRREWGSIVEADDGDVATATKSHQHASGGDHLAEEAQPKKNGALVSDLTSAVSQHPAAEKTSTPEAWSVAARLIPFSGDEDRNDVVVLTCLKRFSAELIQRRLLDAVCIGSAFFLAHTR